MNIKTIIATTIVGATVLYGCSNSSEQTNTKKNNWKPTTTTEYVAPPTTTVQSNQDRVLSALYQAVPFLSQYDDSLVWGLLEATCTDLDNSGGDFLSEGYAIVRAAEANNMPLDASDAGSIMGAAVAGVCPRWIPAARAFANS